MISALALFENISKFLKCFQITSKDGKAFNEKWKRHMHVDGLYKCTKKEKVEEFFKKLNYPDQFINGLDRYKLQTHPNI